MSKEKEASFMPVDIYFGGAEHTTMHLLYSRFWTKALFDLGLVKDKEPYRRRRNRGLILGPDGNKMSKSKGNVIDPDEVVERLGADTVRLYLAFMGPYADGGNYPWDPNGVVGVRRFLERVWKLAENLQNFKVSENTFSTSKILNKTIKKVSEDIENFKFNTCVAQLMILLNAWEKEKEILSEDFAKFLQLLSPFAPHITEELWHNLGNINSIHLAEWPKYDESFIVEDEIKIMIQIDGKTRGEIVVDVEADEEKVKQKALESEIVQKYLLGNTPKKIIYVKGRLINIVI